MQKTRSRSGRKGGYHGYTLSQAKKMLSGDKPIDEIYVSPELQQVKKSQPKTLQDVMYNKEDYITMKLDKPLQKKGIIS